MDKKTTSIFQSFDLNSAFPGVGAQLIVRPPANLKVFRLTVYVSPDFSLTLGGTAYISNQQMTSPFDGVQLSCTQNFYVQTNVPPDTDNGQTTLVQNKIIFDRRGVGYMQDNFYCFGKCFINFVWEGEIS